MKGLFTKILSGVFLVNGSKSYKTSIDFRCNGDIQRPAVFPIGSGSVTNATNWLRPQLNSLLEIAVSLQPCSQHGIEPSLRRQGHERAQVNSTL